MAVLRFRGALMSGVVSSLLLATAASAQTVTYTYDALGRLRASSVSGGANHGTSTAICYDAAGNRSQYVTVVGGPASCSTGLMSASSAIDATAGATAGDVRASADDSLPMSPGEQALSILTQAAPLEPFPSQ